MKNSTVIPLFAVTAAAAFGLGWVVRPDAEGAKTTEDKVVEKVSTSGGRSVSHPSRGGSEKSTREGEFLASYLVNGEISAEDMKAAIMEMSDTNDPLLRQKMMALLLENLTAENAKAAYLALRETRRGGPFGRRNDDELRLLANAWGRIDGAGALAALKEAGAGENNDRGRGGRGGRGDMGGEIASALAGWATVDGAGATDYLNGIEDERESRMAAFGIVQGMLVNGVDEAMSFIQGLPDTEGGERSKGMYMAMVTDEMLEGGLDNAKSWVDTVKDPDLRTGVLARVTMEIMNEDREAAAEWIAQYGDEDASRYAVDRLADEWSREDPKAVLTWADQLSGQSKIAAYDEAMGSWAREDPVAAGEFLGTLDASPERDAAVESYATRVSLEDPVAAMDWANTIEDIELRQDTQVEVAEDWYRKDQAAALEWVETSGLSEDAVKEITEGGGRDDWRRGGGPFGGGRGR